MMSTATKLSKFGLPLMDETRERLIQIYVDNPWLTGIHIHVGSQGVPLERFVSGEIKGMNKEQLLVSNHFAFHKKDHKEIAKIYLAFLLSCNKFPCFLFVVDDSRI